MKVKMDNFIKLVEKGVLITRLVTLALTGICCYLWVVQLPLEETLKTSWLIIIGFWFNSEVTTQLVKYLMEKEKE